MDRKKRAMTTVERRDAGSSDRRRMPRGGGRRESDRPGRYPPVLIVDSYEGARSPCARYLSVFGFQVEEAASGDEAVVAIATFRPHIIISELTLPRASSLVARLSEGSPIPLIVTTTDETARIPTDAVGVLVKPFALSTMLHEMRRVLTAMRRAADGVLGPPD